MQENQFSSSTESPQKRASEQLIARFNTAHSQGWSETKRPIYGETLLAAIGWQEGPERGEFELFFIANFVSERSNHQFFFCNAEGRQRGRCGLEARR
jgi:hypothetical protein